MIHEYALEPELVATWGAIHNCRFFFRAFGPGEGRLVARYPKKWAAKVWEAFQSGSELDRKRLEELLQQMKRSMVKRKDCCWDATRQNWLDNALTEHGRHPFRAIMARDNPQNFPDILTDEDLAGSQCAGWDIPHGITMKREATEMAAAVAPMLSLCRWVRFIDPYISKGKQRHRQSLSAFLKILGAARPVGPPEVIEIHTSGNGASPDFPKNFCKVIPTGLTVSFFQWQERPGGQRLHNRYILTDLGGVAFQHGLDTGAAGETDDITRLGSEQYALRCAQYNITAPAFDQAATPLAITGKG